MLLKVVFWPPTEKIKATPTVKWVRFGDERTLLVLAKECTLDYCYDPYWLSIVRGP